MNMPQPAFESRLRTTARDVYTDGERAILKDIALPGVAAAIWRRRLEGGFQGWINGLPVEQLPEVRISVPVPAVAGIVQAACDDAGMPSCAERNWLVGDIATLADLYQRVLQMGPVTLRLEVAHDITCPKFHVDNVPARLLCTYRGSGTEYVAETGLEDPRRYRSMPTGAVGLFRGGQWPSLERCGLFHRSPMLASGETARLLLVIDPA